MMQKNFASKTIRFFSDLKLNKSMPLGISVMNPYAKDDQVMEIVEEFYKKYFNDNRKRTGMLGINPGRFGAGVTGIAFTDPIHLEEKCGIANDFKKKHELSSIFIYELINKYGGEKNFYNNFYLSSICPLGFLKEGKNMNFYDDKKLEEAVEPFIIKTLKQQIDLGLRTDACLCLGEGKNYKYFDALNAKHALFEKIIPLSHPRFIMQYRRKQKENYLKKYLEVMGN